MTNTPIKGSCTDIHIAQINSVSHLLHKYLMGPLTLLRTVQTCVYWIYNLFHIL